MKKNDFVYIRPDLISYDEMNARGKIINFRQGLYRVSNLNMPFLGTINDWFSYDEISKDPFYGKDGSLFR